MQNPKKMKRMLVSLSYGLAYLAVIGFYSYLKHNELEDSTNDIAPGNQTNKNRLPRNHIEGFKKKKSIKKNGQVVKSTSDSTSQTTKDFFNYNQQ